MRGKEVLDFIIALMFMATIGASLVLLDLYFGLVPIGS